MLIPSTILLLTARSTVFSDSLTTSVAFRCAAGVVVNVRVDAAAIMCVDCAVVVAVVCTTARGTVVTTRRVTDSATRDMATVVLVTGS